MLPFLIFLMGALSSQPEITYDCKLYPSTGPTCTLISVDPDNPNNKAYECKLQGTGDCTYYIGVNGRSCSCYEFKPIFHQIICPWSDCSGGKCRYCDLSGKVQNGETWGGVKQLYR